MKAKRKTKLFEWQQKKFGVCQKCGKEKELSVDHVIPVFFLDQLGLEHIRYDDEDNFELLCFACNRFKGCRIDISNPKVKALLVKYISMI